MAEREFRGGASSVGGTGRRGGKKSVAERGTY